MAHRHQSEINIAKPSTRAEFPCVRYVAPDQEDRPSMLYTLGHESSKRLVSFSEKIDCVSTSGRGASRCSTSRSYGCCCQTPRGINFRLCRGVYACRSLCNRTYF